jgi:hexulose-6-phosphate isomerase
MDAAGLHAQGSRRQFLQSVAAAAAGGAAAASGVVGSAVIGSAVVGSAPQPAFAAGSSGMKKALKYSMVKTDGSLMDKFRLLKQIGFDGVELTAPSTLDKTEVLKARDATGLEIPGVLDSVHWRETLSDPDPEVRARGVAALEAALHDAKAYGATSVLLVPAVVNKQVSYADAYQRSQAEIRKVLPLAEKLDVKIALENVWNYFLLSPLEMARYVDEFESPQVVVHFDVGNVVLYGWPEQWIRTLGKRIYKLDIKEYSRSLAEKQGMRAGFKAKLLEGDCDWPAVMAALGEVGYSGWGSAELAGGGPDWLKDVAARMDRVYAS